MRGDEGYQVEQQGGGSRSMTTQKGSGGQDWTGYVQPYHYYGPGYRGVGYYAVFYQGQGASEGDQDEMTGEQETQPETQFDQRNVHFGQGQGTGAGWQGRGRGRSGRWGWNEAWGGRGRQSGQFAGRGPKGYERSDDRIREEVSDRFTEHGDLDASDIEVEVSGGIVTLSGTIDDRWGKRLAEDIAERVPGVRDVMNQLRVSEEMASGDTTGTQRMTRAETATSGSKTQERNGRRTATAPTR